MDFHGARTIAMKEIGEHFRSKRFFIIGGLFALSIILATVLGSRLYESFGSGASLEGGEAVPALLSLYLSTFQGLLLLKILALVLAADAVVSEWKDRTLFLLLSKPITRTAMLTGKIAAAYLTVLMVFVGGFTIGLVVLLIDVGVPDAEAWGRILGGLALLAAGLFPFVALATMFSTIFKSTATSYALSIVLVLLVLPILFTIIFFIVFITGGADQGAFTQSTTLQILQLIDPSSILNMANYVMVGNAFGASGGIPIELPDVGQAVLYALIALAIHASAYLGISYWMVNRRDYA